MENDERVEETTEEETPTAEEAETSEAKPEEQTATEQDESVDWKQRALKAERAIEKAKAKAKEKAEPTPQVSSNLPLADIVALSKSNLDNEDIKEVLEYANFKKISVSDALSSSVIKATLAEKAEHRKSASVSNTGGGRRAAAGVSDDKLLANAAQGIMPDSENDIKRLYELRIKNRK